MRLLLAAAAALALSASAASAADPLAPTGRWTANMRGQAATPPMGWNSWNAFRTEVTEEKVLGAAQALVDTGLARLGYRYVNIDDGWWLKRRTSDGRLQVRTAIFPSAAGGGFRPFTDRLHAMGLKAGIYSDLGRNSCSQAYDLKSPNLPVGTAEEREVGLYGHVDGDIRLYFADWGFDYIKVDSCGLTDFAPGRDHVLSQDYRPFVPLIDRGGPAQTDIAKVRSLYTEVADALARHNPDGDYVFSICAWGQANVRAWGKQVGNLWRTSDDITPNWTRMLHTFDSASGRALYAQPGGWNDPDMLFIGSGDFDEHHLVEARSHFSLWAIANAPLLIGYDLRNAPKSLLDIWGNADVIAINQDPGGHQGVIAYDSDDVQIIVKTLSDGSKAVALFNRGLAPVEATLMADHLKFAASAPIQLRDLWSKEALAPFTGERSFTLAPRETRLFRASGIRGLADGMYLSELPGSVNVAEDGVVKPEPDPLIHRAASPWSGTRSSGERPNYAGWGGAQADASPYGQPLQIAGRRFASGIGILSNSRLEVRNAGARLFSALVGVDDWTRNPDSKARFYVYGDGRLLASTAAAAAAAAVPIKADISGVKIVELVVRSEGAPTSVVWGDAALLTR
jgi:alpha-galactosidase